jgi:hypothetical protein
LDVRIPEKATVEVLYAAGGHEERSARETVTHTEISELRVLRTTHDFERAISAYRDALGLPVVLATTRDRRECHASGNG